MKKVQEKDLNVWTGKRILVGICGGIAVYKVAELVRHLRHKGSAVSCLLTTAAARFVTPLTFTVLSGRTAYTDNFAVSGPSGWEEGNIFIPHLDLAGAAHLYIVVPATADFLARAVIGRADDLVTNALLVIQCPVIIAPAMNTRMWNHSQTQKNLRQLQKRGYYLVEPVRGELACGAEGPGHLAPLETILKVAANALSSCRA